ncbi:MAG: hypothetical protein ACI81R_001151 [Bradymonadia bacterium]|jgi:hypothetical protein
MEIVVGIFAIIAAGAVVMLLGANSKKGDLEKQLSDERGAREKVKSEASTAKTELADVRKAIDTDKKEISKLRDDAKAAKKRAHSKKEEAEALAAKLKGLNQKQSAYAGVDEAREQMMAAQTDAANLRAEVQTLRSRLGEVEAGAPEPEEGDDGRVDIAVLRDLESKHRALMQEMRGDMLQDNRHDRHTIIDDARSDRIRFIDELRDLRRRLNRSLTDLDKERRRADNTDKAYVILKSQLEAALDRLASVDPSLRRPDAVRPEDLLPPAPPTEAELAAIQDAANEETAKAEEERAKAEEESAKAEMFSTNDAVTAVAPAINLEEQAAVESLSAPAATKEPAAETTPEPAAEVVDEVVPEPVVEAAPAVDAAPPTAVETPAERPSQVTEQSTVAAVTDVVEETPASPSRAEQTTPAVPSRTVALSPVGLDFDEDWDFEDIRVKPDAAAATEDSE